MELRLLYYVTTLLLIIAGATMVALPVRTYNETEKSAMIHLSLGFGLICAAAIVTTISTRMVAFHEADGMLIVHNGMTASGVLFVIYSLLAYE